MLDEPNVPGTPRSVRVEGADLPSMVALDPGYAKDVNRVYYRGKVLTRDVAHLQVLRYDYVKTASEVFHRGVAVAGAHAIARARVHGIAAGKGRSGFCRLAARCSRHHCRCGLTVAIALLQELVGPYNANLARIEQRLGVVLHLRGNTIIIEGAPEAAAIAEEALNRLYGRLVSGMSIEMGDIDAAARLAQNAGRVFAEAEFSRLINGFGPSGDFAGFQIGRDVVGVAVADFLPASFADGIYSRRSQWRQRAFAQRSSLRNMPREGWLRPSAA